MGERPVLRPPADLVEHPVGHPRPVSGSATRWGREIWGDRPAGLRPAPPCAKHPESLAVHRRRLAALCPRRSRSDAPVQIGPDPWRRRRCAPAWPRGRCARQRRGRARARLQPRRCPNPTRNLEFGGRRGNGGPGRPSGSPGTSSTSKTGNPGSLTILSAGQIPSSIARGHFEDAIDSRHDVRTAGALHLWMLAQLSKVDPHSFRNIRVS